MATAHVWTRAELEWFPNDGNRYEVLDGALLVTPQPSFQHQEVALAIATRLTLFAELKGNLRVAGPAEITDGRSELQPDIAVFAGPRGVATKWADLPRPVLVVEILSLSTRGRDLGIKRAAYERWGVKECWFVDPEARSVRVARAGQADDVVTSVLHWIAPDLTSALEIDVEALPW